MYSLTSESRTSETVLIRVAESLPSLRVGYGMSEELLEVGIESHACQTHRHVYIKSIVSAPDIAASMYGRVQAFRNIRGKKYPHHDQERTELFPSPT
jgi:hypothetical protein